MKKKKLIIITLVVSLLITMMPMSSFAAVKSVAAPVEVKTLMSSYNLKHNFVKVTAEGRNLKVQCETPLKAKEFNFSVRRVKPSSSSSKWIKRAYPTYKGGYYAYSTVISSSGLKGDYILIITMTRKSGAKSELVYKNCNFRVKNGQMSILKYNTIVNANKRIARKNSGHKKSSYTNRYLSDIKNIVFRNPKTKKVAPVTKAKVDYFKKVSKTVTKGAKNNYEKTLKIYEYITKNIYYDDIAFSTGRNQYLDPYLNLYNMRNKKTSANSSKGKVATTCVGNAALVIALTRAQGIPSRLVNGHHVGMSGSKYYNWTTEPAKSKIDHWWAEVYVDGRWIVVDPTPGNGNRWNRTTGKWTTTGLLNYIYFDPTLEQLSTSHVTYNIK